ncbi:MAG: hypothetical protein QOJ00_206 [Actinomycetota bacterium]|jgi:hypothetical protein
MRTSLRVFAAAFCTLFAAAFLVAVPFSSPAHAVSGFNTVNISSASVTEGQNLVFTISVTPEVHADTISATVKTEDLTASSTSSPADYTPVGPTTFTWGFGDSAPKTLTVHSNDDGTREPTEQFLVVFAQPPVAADQGTTGTGTLTDNDTGTVPQITTSGGGNHTEGDSGTTNHDISVTVDKTYDQDVTVHYATQDGTAHAGSDYTATSGTLTFPKSVATAQTQHVLVPVTGDTFPEPAENFLVTFSQNSNAAFAGNPNQTVTIQAEDGAPPQVTIADIPDKVEGDSGTSTMTVTLNVSPLPQQPISVNVETSDGTAVASTQDTTGDYVAVPKHAITIGTGQGSTTFPVTINGDVAQEPDEIFHVTISDANNATVGSPSTKDAKILNDDFGQITTGAGSGGGPDVETFGASGARLAGFFAYEQAFAGGVHVARGDFFKADGTVGADGIDEIVTAPGNNSRPLVRVFALDGTIRASFFAFDQNFSGGVYVAAGNLDGDTSNGDELVVAAGPGGGPHVKVLKIKGGGDNVQDISNGGFMAYTTGFRGGVRVAVANESGDAKDEIITSPGPGGGPHVRVLSVNSNNVTETAGFMAYDPGFTGGVFVGASAGKIVTGAGAGGGPHVRMFNGNGTAQGDGFFAYAPSFTGGVSVALGNLDSDPAAEIVTGAGPGGGPHVRAFKQDGSAAFGTGFFAYPSGFTGGVEVSIGNGGS